MDSIIEGFKRAFLLIFNLDAELISIIFLSLRVSGKDVCVIVHPAHFCGEEVIAERRPYIGNLICYN